jgi:hypothetical protein
MGPTESQRVSVGKTFPFTHVGLLMEVCGLTEDEPGAKTKTCPSCLCRRTEQVPSIIGDGRLHSQPNQREGGGGTGLSGKIKDFFGNDKQGLGS